MKRSALFLGTGVIAMLLGSLAMAKQPMVEVCHKGTQTIRIAAPAVPAHVRHGDTACACEVIDDCTAEGGDLDPQTCECHVDPEGCEPEVVEDCSERGGDLDPETCECQTEPGPYACEPAGTYETGYVEGCNENPDCACEMDGARNGVCTGQANAYCEDLDHCPDGQGPCPDGFVCVIESGCTNYDPPNVCVPLCPPAE
jgi:hypothetical protein